METQRTLVPEESGIALEASDWLVELADEPAPRLGAFAAWLKASPRHVEEFLLVSTIWRELDGTDPERQIAVDSLVAEVQGSVLELNAGAISPASVIESARPVWARRSALAGFALAATIAGIWLVNPALLGGPQIYGTDMGEHRAVKLEDGSIAHLNTDSKLSVRYTDTTRNLTLLRGEALFDVEHDSERPFVVATDVAAVRAVGTQFDVYRRQDATTVSVVQGVVEVAAPAPNRILRAIASSAPALRPTRIAAGEQAVVAPRGEIVKTAAANAVALAIAWRERRLVFRGDTLRDVAQEFNRYNRRPIRIENEAVAQRLLTGVFDADDPDSLLQFLATDPALALEARPDEVIVRAARAGEGPAP